MATQTESQKAAAEAREAAKQGQDGEKAQPARPKTATQNGEKPTPAAKPPKADKPKAEKKDDKPKQQDDPNLQLAHRATVLATGCETKENGAPDRSTDKTKFGASVTSKQVAAVKDAVKGKDILKLLGCSDAQLKGYATDRSKGADLPEETRKFLREFNKQFPPKMKMWARKDAAILYELVQERKRASRRSSKKEKAAA
jgi:hypothetical protein